MRLFKSFATSIVLLATPAALAQDTFHGYPCTEDCSGHGAGYDWAEQNGIADESDCGGNSTSFVEGCYAYVEENEGNLDEEESFEEEE